MQNHLKPRHRFFMISIFQELFQDSLPHALFANYSWSRSSGLEDHAGTKKSQEEMQWEMGSVIELPAPAEGPSPAPSFLVLILFFPISLFLIFFLFYFLSSCLPFPFHFLHYYSCLTTADKHWETQRWNLLVKGSLLVSLVINHHL